MQKKKTPKRSWIQELADSINGPSQPKEKKAKVKPISSPLRQKPPRKPRKKPSLSNSRKALLKAYRESKGNDLSDQKCACCKIKKNKLEMDPHHPCGRKGKNLLFYIYLCHLPCHILVHEKPAWAEEKGLLWKGRNRKNITEEEWNELKRKML